MIPPEGLIKSALKNYEITVNRQGWDKPPQFLMIFALTPNLLRLAQMPLPDGSPAQILKTAASEMRKTEKSELREVLALPSFAGLAAITETWANNTITPDEYQALRATGRRMADHPASYEARDLLAVDCAGRSHSIHRKRGDKTTYLAGLGGGMIGAIKEMVLMVAEQMPPGTADVEAIQALHLTTQEEMESIVEQRIAGVSEG